MSISLDIKEDFCHVFTLKGLEPEDKLNTSRL